MSVVVGVLTIDLKANTASFSQSMDKMSSLSAKTANDIKRSLEKIAVAGVAMAGALATGTVAMIKGALDSADAMGKMAQAAGTTVETLSTLNYAAQLSNVATEQLVKGLEKLSVSAFKAQNGNAQLVRIFGRLGVSATDANGNLKDSGVLMEQVAVKFAKMADGGGKTALAYALFGKAGAALIPMLNQYGEEQEKVNDEAHRFGLVLSTSTVEVAMRAHDNLDRLGLALKGIGFSVLSATLPALDQLLEKLINLAKNTDIQGLARSFGGEVVSAVNLLGNALEFAAKHATALKVAMGALVGLKVAQIALPVIGDLAAGGTAKLGDGISRLVLSLLGLQRAIPALAQLGKWITATTAAIRLFVATEGLAYTAGYLFGGALAILTSPITITIGLLAALTGAMYAFRNSTFTAKGQVYEMRDAYKALWQVLTFQSKGTDTHFTDVLARIKAERQANSPDVLRFLKASETDITPAGAKKTKPAADTSGLGTQKENPVDKLLANLQEKLDEAKQSLAAAGLEEEAQRKVAAANKASNEIMKLGQEIAKQTGATTKDYASLVDATTQALIREKNAEISDVEAKTKLLDVIGAGSRASALSIAQSGLMVEAMDKGSDAILRQASRTQAWNELRTKGGSITEIQARSQEIYAESVAKESQAIQGNIINLQQELAARQIVNEAVLGSLQAQDEAALRAKLYGLDVQIAGAAAGELKDKLLALRGAMIALNDEEKLKQDLDNARALKSPAEQYALEQEKLSDTVEALRKVQGGTISYGQSLQIAMKEQENFTKLIDETVKSLLFEGTAADGMKAFFLDMQKQAITAGQIIYEALHQAFTKLSDNLTQLITGGKTSFAQMFKDIGRQMVNMSIQSGLQKGLGALGKVLPASIGGPLSQAFAGKPDGSSASSALWVRMASSSGSILPNFGQGGNGIGGKGGMNGALGVGTGVMGTGITGLFGGRGGDVDGLAVRDPTDLLGGWKPGDGEGGDANGGSDTGGGIAGGILSMLGGIFGGKKGKPDGSKNNPLFVQMGGGGLGGSGGGILDALGGGSSDQTDGGGGGSSKAGGIFGFLGSLFSKGNSSSGDSGGDSGGGDSGGNVWAQLLKTVIGAFSSHAQGGPISGPGTGTSDSIPARLSNGEFVVRAAPAAKFKDLLQHINKGGNVHKTPGFAAGGFVGYADGGTVASPSNAYSMQSSTNLAAASGQITGNTATRRGQGSTGPNLYYTIDARGTDPVLTEQRTRAALIAVHNSSVTNAVQVNAELIKRTPQRSQR